MVLTMPDSSAITNWVSAGSDTVMAGAAVYMAALASKKTFSFR
jgi:hypothetical protein